MIVMTIARGLVLAALLYASSVALTHWAVRRKHLSPFGPWAKFNRRISDPMLVPLERRIVLAGRNPQDAPLWLLGIVVGGGLVFVTLVGWGASAWGRYAGYAGGGPRGWAILAINASYSVLMLALIVRVIGSWFGVGPYRPWMKPAYVLTDWMVNPIRRLLPATGMFDFSPLVAWVLLVVLHRILELKLG